MGFIDPLAEFFAQLVEELLRFARELLGHLDLDDRNEIAATMPSQPWHTRVANPNKLPWLSP